MIHFKLDATNSTNSYLKELVHEGVPRNWTVVSAREQRQGRGQQGAVWFSDKSKNLTFSILIKEVGLIASDQFLLNCAVSNGIFKAMQTYETPRVKVKWPNDIMSGSSKLAGILIENSLVSDRITHSIVGIGLNVNQDEFPPYLPDAVSMKQRTGKNYNLDAILESLVKSIKLEIGLIETGQYEALRQNYAEHMYRRNSPHMFRVPFGQPFLAEIRGATDKGLLILRKEDGSESNYAFKEIEYL
jgi:BirA family biotin operon repressor/biotin-[acetyl-CoA-carboxylase] ligase